MLATGAEFIFGWFDCDRRTIRQRKIGGKSSMPALIVQMKMTGVPFFLICVRLYRKQGCLCTLVFAGVIRPMSDRGAD